MESSSSSTGPSSSGNDGFSRVRGTDIDRTVDMLNRLSSAKRKGRNLSLGGRTQATRSSTTSVASSARTNTCSSTERADRPRDNEEQSIVEKKTTYKLERSLSECAKELSTRTTEWTAMTMNSLLTNDDIYVRKSLTQFETKFHPHKMGSHSFIIPILA